MAKVAASETTTPSDDVAEWLSLIDQARKDMRDYEMRCDKIRKKYVYENSQTVKRRRFQMLWANQEILRPAVYARRPSPSVTNRWKDGDAVARITCELLERNLDFQFDVCDYDHAFQQVRDDYLLFGRGVCRLRYEPTFKDEINEGEDDDDAARPQESDASDGGGASGSDDGRDGDQTPSDEVDEGEQAPETLKFENVHLDFVQLTDFVHPKARTWKELPWLDYISYLDREALIKRFGEKIGKKIQLDTTDAGKKEDTDKRVANSEAAKKATIHEIWDKSRQTVLWVSEGYPDVLDSGPPYLKFEGFFPSPRPAYGTLATDSLVPHPDFIFYQDQAEEIDELTARIGHLTDSLKLVGFYPAGPNGEGAPEIEKAVRPGFENKMIAVRSWAAFAQGGKAGAPIVWLPVDQVSEILKGCVELRKQLIDDVYQLTGISDIIRGTTEAEETAAAQGLKSQWGSLRLNVRQKELARLAKDVTRMAAEVISKHFQMSTLVKCANMKIPTEADNQQQIEKYQLALRNFQQQQMMQQMQHQALPPSAPAGAPTAAAPGVGPSAGPQGPGQGRPAAPPPMQGPMGPMGPPHPGLGAPSQPPTAGSGAPSGPPQPGSAPAPKPPAPPQLQPTQEDIAELMKDAVTQRFLIDIEVDSTIAADENAEKAARTQVLESISKFVVAWMPITQAAPELLPLAGEMLLFAVRAFPTARDLEEAIEEAMDKMEAAAGQPKPPNAEQLKAQADLQKAQAEIQTAQIDAASAGEKAKADIAQVQLKGQVAVKEHEMKLQQMQMEMQIEREKMQMELHGQQQKHQMDLAHMQSDAQIKQQALQAQHQMSMEATQAQGSLEQQKQAAAQKTLAQQVAADEQKMVAKQSMDQFTMHSKRQLMEDDLKSKREMANMGPEPKPQAPVGPAPKRNFQIQRGGDGRMSGISEL